MARRVVVTGLGILSPNGNTVKEAWENTKNGVNGIGPLTKAGAEGLPIHFAGELKNLDVLDYLDKKEARRLDEYSSPEIRQWKTQASHRAGKCRMTGTASAFWSEAGSAVSIRWKRK